MNTDKTISNLRLLYFKIELDSSRRLLKGILNSFITLRMFINHTYLS